MAQRKPNVNRMRQALEVAHSMSTIDQASSEQEADNRQKRVAVRLGQIKQRQQDTRGLKQTHVLSLVESIGVLGLLEPLVLDIRYRLLAGGHRLAAIEHLRSNSPEKFETIFPSGLIPVRIMPFDADLEQELALQCEVAENEHRRDYTPNEVKQLAERLRSAGYSHGKGRPRKGSKPLLPALEVIIGKHSRTIQRYLSDKDDKPKNTTNVAFSSELKILQRSKHNLESWYHSCSPVESGSNLAILQQELPRFLSLIEQAIRELSCEE